jgi:hypothetical protein
MAGTHRVAEAKAHEEAIGGTLARYTVGLVPDDGLKIGTGVLVSSGADRYVATARHFVRDVLQNGDVYCLPKSRGTTRILEKDDVPGMLARGELPLVDRVLLPITRRILSADGSDVALLRLQCTPSELSEMEFYPLENARSEAAELYVIVCGFPFDLTLVNAATRQAAAFSRPVHGVLRTVSEPEYIPHRNLVVAYKNFEGTLAAAGMSGGGVWSPPALPTASAERPWDPRNLVLLGIQIGQFSREPSSWTSSARDAHRAGEGTAKA